MATDNKDQVECMVPDCTEKARWKGICGKCYHQARELVHTNKTTWEELAEMGLCKIEDKKLLSAFLSLKKRACDAS